MQKSQSELAKYRELEKENKKIKEDNKLYRSDILTFFHLETLCLAMFFVNRLSQYLSMKFKCRLNIASLSVYKLMCDPPLFEIKPY